MKSSQPRTLIIKIAVLLPFVPAICGESVMSRAFGLTLNPGDILVADPDFNHNDPQFGPLNPTVWKIDPLTGVRDVLTSKEHGGGAYLSSPFQVVVDSLGRITVADAYTASLLRVDPTTGDRSYLTGGGVGTGAFYLYLSAIALDHDDSIVLLDHGSKNIVRVDPNTGDRSLVTGPARGQGPEITLGTMVAVDAAGSIWTSSVGDDNQAELIRVEPTTGNRQLVSGPGVGSGPDLFGDIRDLLFVDNHTAIVTTPWHLIEVDLVTGDRSYINLNGPPIDHIFALDRGLDGSLLVSEGYNGRIYRVDLASGNETLLSGDTHAYGPLMSNPMDLAVIAPEPGSAVLIGVALFSAIALRRRRR